MNCSTFKETICRICLKRKVHLNWNDKILEFCGVSYKDCYYKYTKLEEQEEDSYPTGLCEKCAEDLRNAHKLFEKALDSFRILLDLGTKYFDIDMCIDSLPAIKDEPQAFDVDHVEPEEKQVSFMDLYASEKNSESKSLSSESNKIDMNEVASVDPTHFVDIHNFDSSFEIPFEEHFGELYDSEVSKPLLTKKNRRKRNKSNAILRAHTKKQNETSDSSSFNTKKARRRKQCVVSSKDTSTKTTEDCNITDGKIQFESNDDIALENSNTNTPKLAKRSKEKYLLMCSYCSLKVDGAKKLEKHEATHNENRERTFTCQECGLKFYTDCSLTLHMKIHDANRQKNHKCEFCDKAFFNKGALNVHRRIHLGLMIKCQICEKEFFRQVDLDKHLLKHSASPLEKNVGKKKNVAQCQYCNKSILTDKLKEHIAIHLNQPQVKCKICDKNFYSRTKCTKHLRRFHLKNLSEYEDHIHYYVDRNKRLSSLMIKQHDAQREFHRCVLGVNKFALGEKERNSKKSFYLNFK